MSLVSTANTLLLVLAIFAQHPTSPSSLFSEEDPSGLYGRLGLDGRLELFGALIFGSLIMKMTGIAAAVRSTVAREKESLKFMLMVIGIKTSVAKTLLNPIDTD